MSERDPVPAGSLRDTIRGMNRQELCAFVAELCKIVKNETGNKEYRGGIYPENISLAQGGGFCIGPGRLSDWEREELQFIAPELYWHGKGSQASDVYSLGLLLYYGLTGGKLPFEGESPDAQLSRMSGKEIKAPKNAGRLGEIIEKAVQFKELARYANVEQLQIMIESCMDNKYLDGIPSSELLFSKQGEQLSDIERMMLSIIENDGKTDREDAAEKAASSEGTMDTAPLDEQAIGEILGTVPEIVPQEEEKPDLVREYFGEPEKENAPEQEKAASEGVDAVAENEHNAENPAPEEDETEIVKLYEPVTPKKDSKTGRQPIPILTEEKNPVLAPVVPTIVPKVQYTQDPERNKQVEQDVKKRRRRPLLVVFVLCAFLLIAALGANFILQNRNRFITQTSPRIVTPTAEPSPEGGNAETVVLPDGGQTQAEVLSPDDTVMEPTPEPTEPPETFYQIFKADVSWTEAQSRCRELGGHLVVINSQEELDEVVRLAENYGIARIWIGGHRVNGNMVWETGEEVDFLPWGQGEPSSYDSYDGAAEDYILLWNNNGWAYNDSRNDPASEFPEWYSGTIGYIAEFGT